MRVCYILSFLLLFNMSTVLLAQNIGRDRFEEFKRKRTTAFKKFKEDKDAAFTEYLRNKWEKYQLYKGIKRPELPEPINPVVKDNDIPVPPPVQLPIEPEPILSPIVIKPIILPETLPETTPLPDRGKMKFTFFGTECFIRKVNLDINLSSISEESVANAWEVLSENENISLINDFYNQGKKLQLNDWGYVELAKEISKNLFPGKINEQILLQGFLLTQFNLDIRLVRESSGLLLAVCAEEEIYGKMYVIINNNKYYLIDPKDRGSVHTFKNSYSKKVRPLRMTADIPIELFFDPSEAKTFTSKAYPEMSVTLNYNKNQTNFYDKYPQCYWSVYANFPLDRKIEQTLKESFSPMLSGKTEIEAANMLLNFVQTAFEYKTDGEQFGHERPFFAEELFKFPYCDCEDRSVLFSKLVKIFLNRPVVLLDYPSHIATAVNFSEDVKGDYIMIKGEKYVICDPTYIGARIGEAMPKFKNISASVINIK